MAEQTGKILIVAGGILLIVGLVLLVGSKTGLGKLPGDIIIKRPGFSFYLPLTTSVILSILLSLGLYLYYKLRG